MQYLFDSRQPRHIDTLFVHTIKVVQNFPDNDYILRLSALLHDVAKPYTVNSNNEFNCLIRNVSLSNMDSTLFYGTNYTKTDDFYRYETAAIQPSELQPILEYSENSLIFHYFS